MVAFRERASSAAGNKDPLALSWNVGHQRLGHFPGSLPKTPDASIQMDGRYTFRPYALGVRSYFERKTRLMLNEVSHQHKIRNRVLSLDNLQSIWPDMTGLAVRTGSLSAGDGQQIDCSLVQANCRQESRDELRPSRARMRS